ncbi:hypothetical protein ACHQM5_021994 [Ranunculus cassubicifolius]
MPLPAHHHGVSIIISSKLNSSRRSKPPIIISTNPSHINPHQLTDLFTSANLSCHRFPNLDPSTGRVEPVDTNKLRLALSHSSVLVSVFQSEFQFSVLQWNNNRQQLVGFGRAVSDHGLTASIHDVVVLPSLQGLGIGRKIVNRIVRVLTSRGIYDISALCSNKERLFFDACGFGDDILASTTMIYTKHPPPSTCGSGGDKIVGVSAGRKLLLVPPQLKKRPPTPPSPPPHLR